jgi:hypothetical protein
MVTPTPFMMLDINLLMEAENHVVGEATVLPTLLETPLVEKDAATLMTLEHPLLSVVVMRISPLKEQPPLPTTLASSLMPLVLVPFPKQL